mmetsp:Transcript_2662/g.7541  ORF Transcript_2662/g.7541 Transcript_2662/m.7541 type:complete len:1630 (-) Transcript_2662:717-5606(-)
MVTSLTNAIRYHPGGWRAMEATCWAARTAAVARQLDGWGLLVSLVGDVVAALVAADGGVGRRGPGGAASASPRKSVDAATEASGWVAVPTLGAAPCRDNVLGLLAVADELLAGVLLSPQSGGLPTAPSVPAVKWADKAGADPSAVELHFSAEVWTALGAPPMQGKLGCDGHWHGAWHLAAQLLELLQVLHRDSCPADGPHRPLTRCRSSSNVLNFLAQEGPDEAGPPGGGGDGTPAISPVVLRCGTRTRDLRMAFRLLLLYLQQAPLDIATKGVSAAVDVIGRLFCPDEECWDMAHYMVYVMSWVRDCLDPSNSVTGSFNSRVASMLGHESTGEARLTLARRCFVQIFEACREAIVASCQQKDAEAAGGGGGGGTSEKGRRSPRLRKLDPSDGEAISEALQDARIVRCASTEVLFLSHLAICRHASVERCLRDRRTRDEEVSEALSLFQASLQERTVSLCEADAVRRAGLRLTEDEQEQRLQRAWRKLQRRLTTEQALWTQHGAPAGEPQVRWKLDMSEDSHRRHMKLRVNHSFMPYDDDQVGGGGSERAHGVASTGTEGGTAASGAEQSGREAEAEPSGSGRMPSVLSLPKEAIRHPIFDSMEGSDDPLQPSGSEGAAPDNTPEGTEDGSGRGDSCSKAPSAGQGELQAEAVVGFGSTDGEVAPPLAAPQFLGRSGGQGGCATLPEESATGSHRHSETLSLEPEEATKREDATEPATARPTSGPRGEEGVGVGHAGASTPKQQVPAEETAEGREAAEVGSRVESGSSAGPLSRVPSDSGVAAGNDAEVVDTPTVGAKGEAIPTSMESMHRVMNGEEVVLYAAACTLVTYKRTMEGCLELTPAHLHFAGGTGRAAAAASTVSAAAEEGRDRLGSLYHRRWRTAELSQVHHARYMLQPTALELFTKDRSSVFLDFGSLEALKEVVHWLASLAPTAVIYDRRKKLELAERLAARWRRWEISNFDYLMQLNTLASRSYNDLNQYPVFPWVLADYRSEALDLNNPASFRDLSRPVGALNDKQMRVFKERYESIKDDLDVPPFHYGSHYSTSGIVLYYMIRMEPFTALARQLQGGTFDHADRMLNSMEETWQNLHVNTSDTKELIPEFYYNAEFLLNSNKHSLGQRQDGVVLGDVVLPPWANGSATEFVRIMREALESEYVSNHLHEWIDLIFGHKQRGKAAEDAVNVYYYLTYEGAVDLDAIDDPAQRAAVRDQIGHFGQTPVQLFKRRHVKRGTPPPPSVNPLLNAPDVMIPSAAGFPTGNKRAPVVNLSVMDSRIVMATADCLLLCHKWVSPRRDTAFNFGGDGSYSIELDASSPRRLRGIIDRRLPRELLSTCMAVAPAGRVLLTGGHLDASLRATMVDDGRLLQVLVQHKNVITSLAISEDGSAVVTGSRDTNVIVWETNLAELTSPSSSVSARRERRLPLKEQPRLIVYGHRAEVTCVAASSELDVIISGSVDGLLMLHTLGKGVPTHCIRMPGAVPPSIAVIDTHQALLVIHSHQDAAIRSFTFTGRLVAAAEGSSERLYCMARSPCMRFLMTGGERGQATLRTLSSLQAVISYEVGHGAVTAVAITPEECFMIGSADGSLVLFSPDNRRHITRRLSLVGGGRSSKQPQLSHVASLEQADMHSMMAF